MSFDPKPNPPSKAGLLWDLRFAGPSTVVIFVEGRLFPTFMLVLGFCTPVVIAADQSPQGAMSHTELTPYYTHVTMLVFSISVVGQETGDTLSPTSSTHGTAGWPRGGHPWSPEDRKRSFSASTEPEKAQAFYCYYYLLVLLLVQIVQNSVYCLELYLQDQGYYTSTP